jgi:cobalt-zinc-cadmium resistance protein CzcA
VPRLREGTIVINTVRLAGVSLDESVRYGTQIERRCSRSSPTRSSGSGPAPARAEVATDPMGVELSDVFITLKPREAWTRADTQDELVEAMQRLAVGAARHADGRSPSRSRCG